MNSFYIIILDEITIYKNNHIFQRKFTKIRKRQAFAIYMDKQYKRIFFGLKVKEFRTAKKLSFSELSKKTGMSISYLNEIEKGKKYPKDDKIEILAKTFGVTPDTLTSFELNSTLLPVEELLRSNFLSELPLDLFGIELQKVVEMISKAPARVGAFISTLVELSRNYALQEDNFYFGAMRAYQELHYNFFDEIELQLAEFKRKHKLYTDKVTAKNLENILLNEYGCKVDKMELSTYPELQNVHSIFIKKQNKLLIQENVSEAQFSLLLGRELGYRYLGLKERPYFAPLRAPKSFEPVLSNFKVTYFATAMMMNKDKVAKAVEKFCSREKWDGDALVKIAESYNVTPEMFVHRLTNIMPKYFQLKQLFFIRMRTKPLSEKYTIDKVLHLNQRHHPHSNKIYEHYCRRWVSVDALKELQKMRKDGEARVIARVQKSKYYNTEDEYLVITLAIPAGPLQDKDISVTFGILMDDWLRKVVRYTSDPSIPFRIVNKTCERCPIMDCEERAANPYVYEQKQEWKATQDKLREIIKG